MPERLALVLIAAALFLLLWAVGRRWEARRLRGLTPRLPGGRPVEAHPQVLYFWGDYCLDCRRQGRALEELRRLRPEVEVVAVKAVEAPELADHYLVYSLPSTVVLANGLVRSVHRGFAPADRLAQLLPRRAPGSSTPSRFARRRLGAGRSKRARQARPPSGSPAPPSG